MTIHGDHPFLPAADDRDPLRRWRGRMPAPVSVWTSTAGGRSAGWTLSSFLLADGRPPEVVGLVDEEADFADQLALSGRFAVSLLAGPHRHLADVFAGQAPAPGGVFTVGRWRETAWGPVLEDAVGWLGAALVAADVAPGQPDPAQPGAEPHPDRAGWSLLVRGRVEHTELAEPDERGVLCSFRGRYLALGAGPGDGPASLRP
ncbi:NADH-FMN oxidoreductase RutF, flavin reductase (DIM6/NTAB) family [Friedmanniella luteola]|uniref:NADH-FMN oxidoreductase RutF, flavin reductase (DIM6/NTAB) family n=1 Tax=Friedmanniella luteola TaxID=546871 RepID=A0A1H1QN51_9ACTN|nr:flavin reductase family protein [Friedmanniella luteola]SDS24892.1 NADH-FMN oxidoreductase RutF, flavin reductase (DIM6/NTAB) family [Friedmanniella luteola]